MKRFRLVFLATGLFLFASLSGQNGPAAAFARLNDAPIWRRAMKDTGQRKWQRKWLLDGLRATVRNTPGGMVISGGPLEGDDACHGVLWTKQSFTGDLKIEYTYTRTDTRVKWVNILYVQATGAGDNPADIAAWRQERVIPSMRTYFNGMNALHVSYAAYHRDNEDSANDYVRARLYPVPVGGRFKDTQLQPSYDHSGLFRPGVPYRITVIKTMTDLYFRVVGDNKSEVFHWPLPDGHPVRAGRIGLRQMYTRSARYGNFEVWERR